MKYLFLILSLFSLSLFSLSLQAAELSPQSKLALAEGAVALTVGTPVLLASIATGKTEQLCWVLEGNKKPSSYYPNPDGKDQCPNGNWLRIIPYLKQD